MFQHSFLLPPQWVFPNPNNFVLANHDVLFVFLAQQRDLCLFAIYRGGNLQGGLKKPQTLLWSLGFFLQKSETFVMNMTDEMKALANNAVSWVFSRFRCLCFVLVPNNHRKSQVQVFVCENRWKSVCAVFLQLFEMFEHVCSKKIITVEVFIFDIVLLNFIFILKLLLLHETYIDTIYIYDIYTPGVWNMFVLYFLWVERLKPSKSFFHSKQGSQFVFHIYMYIYI